MYVSLTSSVYQKKWKISVCYYSKANYYENYHLMTSLTKLRRKSEKTPVELFWWVLARVRLADSRRISKPGVQNKISLQIYELFILPTTFSNLVIKLSLNYFSCVFHFIKKPVTANQMNDFNMKCNTKLKWRIDVKNVYLIYPAFNCFD